ADKLHRDIKPSNVLVTASGRVVLLDFGLVAEATPSDLGPNSAVAQLAGTPIYMSPEQLARRALSPASDWYSVGVMLYQALTGVTPHAARASDWVELAMRRKLAPPPPSAVRAGIPVDLEALCMRLLHPDPKARASGDDILRCQRDAAPMPVLGDPS